MSIYAFAFSKRNISCTTLYKLENIDNRYLLWGKASIDKYCEKLIKDSPEYILGMGIYSRKTDKIIIERECHNKFRKELISATEQEILDINAFIKEDENFKFSKTIGNSWCNLISYKIQSLINSGKLKSKYTFLHLSKNLNPEFTSKAINNALSRIKDF